MAEDFTPRPYQVELMKIALKKNTVLYLPTGSGKTFIAVLVLKGLCAPLLKKYSEGGKITVMLVNSIPLVDQHAKYVLAHTNFKVGQYTGEMNLDFWPREKWYEEYDTYQVLIMTCQILYNIISQNFIDLNKVNLLIFDECHHAVNDHPMRSIMKAFNGLRDPPRVLGLTATLLNRNCTAQKVLQEVETLETTFHGQVATVDGLSQVIGYSTNPREDFAIYGAACPSYNERIAINLIEKVREVALAFKLESASYTLSLKPLNKPFTFKELTNMLDEIILHITTLGMYGAVKATVSYMIQVECLKKHCQDLNMLGLFSYIITTLSFIKQIFTQHMKKYSEREQIEKFSSDKILKLIEIFREYKNKSNEELCAIIFTKRRFTAKILYHIIYGLTNCNPEFKYIKPDYMVGYNSNPYNSTRENLFISKKNKQVIESFRNKETNVIVSSSVLEEGVDMQKCTLVVRFDLPEDYRGYIQSKGRARHKSSIYYMMVEQSEFSKFHNKYKEYQAVEGTLNTYLVGKNKERDEPSQENINMMYTEDMLPPYYVAGRDSAFVDMQTAIALVCQYCSSIPSDIYTTYAPEWYIETKTNIMGEVSHSVVILLPIASPLRDIIQGQFMLNVKDAKKAAALEACKRLHKAGELDDHLLPKKHRLIEEDVQFLFQHYPKKKEEKAGFTSNRRLYPIQVPNCLKGCISPESIYYLHIICLNPEFKQSTDINDSTMYDRYTSSTCYGLLTVQPVPLLCDFPIYVTLGTINVSLKINQAELTLNNEDLHLIKYFHFTLFDGILKILKSFVFFDNSSEAEALLVVPVNKQTNKIDFDILRKQYEIKHIVELTSDEKQKLVVTPETFSKQIVMPWYRDPTTYVVSEVCLSKSALSLFPNEDYGTYKNYFAQKHAKLILCPDLPLLLVKGITKRLNFIKPRGREIKRKRDREFEEMTEHLLPELVVKQNFPSDLWIQASFLPTILSRFTYMIRLEELRRKIATESGLGIVHLGAQPPLTLDDYLLEREQSSVGSQEDDEDIDIAPVNEKINMSIAPTGLQMNKDFASKVLEAEYPWKDLEEPKNILKSLDVSLMEIEHYEAFVNKKMDKKENYTLKNHYLNKPLAITYPSNFIPKKIAFLENDFSINGPTLKDFYGAMTCAKADDIVNLERLETLGDSFLKLISSVYITLRFPSFSEGRATQLKGRLVSNKNLYYLAKNKNISGIMRFSKLSPREEWLPPAFRVPKDMTRRIVNREISINSLYHLSMSLEEQLSGTLTQNTREDIKNENDAPDDTEDACYNNLASFLGCQYIGDKFISDVAEALLGCYYQTCGFQGAIKFLEWFGLFPSSENVLQLLEQPLPNPILKKNALLKDVLFHIPQWQSIEETLGYKFKNHAYLLQALTHSSYAPNRITLSYEKLEFLGDAVLDFLITCYIYESCGKLNPGELTDLRSALVNNNTFASLVVRNGLHKFLLMINSTLQSHIDKFVEFLKGKNYDVDNEILILLNEDELHMAEYVDVPKVLGDVFEALAGAIYLDSGKDLKVVWEVFHKIMWKEIDLFSKDIPKNAVRLLFEKQGIYPEFRQTRLTANGKTLVPLEFKLEGRTKTVYGCGTNKIMAKKAAAKLALRCLNM